MRPKVVPLTNDLFRHKEAIKRRLQDPSRGLIKRCHLKGNKYFGGAHITNGSDKWVLNFPIASHWAFICLSFIDSILGFVVPSLLSVLSSKTNDKDTAYFYVFKPCPAKPGYILLCKLCRSRSVGFWRSQLIWICSFCHQVCEFIAKIQIEQSDWLKIRSGCDILIYSAGQGLNWRKCVT